jgi:hypothetical protein
MSNRGVLAGVPRSSRRRARCAVSALLLVALGACHSWRPAPPAPDTANAAHFAHARLVTRDGARLTMADVQVRADSVVGVLGAERARRAIARSDVARIESRQVSAERTTLGVIGGVAVLVLVLYAIALNSVLTGWSEAAADR